MKSLIGFLLSLVVSAGMVQSDPLPRERQREILDALSYITGQTDRPSEALAEGAHLTGEGAPIVKCGMPTALDFMLNRDRFDKELLQAAGINLSPRPVLVSEQTHVSPLGLFKVHYTTVGGDAVVPGDNPPNGIPDYVERTAIILDSVHHNIVEVLGYPKPPLDNFYPAGGDSLYDVYLLDLGSGAYGLTWADSLFIGPDAIWATSFMELDRNYDGLPDYVNRPLDAIRVTAAHEYFHAVQFGIDFLEADYYETGPGPVVARYWMEMSAVWMEEKLYDNINDYYNYLPEFFESPRFSLQQFDSYYDLRPYANGIFPVFLEQYYDDTLIHAIWEGCGELGAGPHFLLVANAEIDTFTNHTQQWPQAVREFTLWNWFTGTKSALAPAGVGYEEGSAYPMFADNVFMYTGSYPDTVRGNENPLNPLHNGGQYIVFDSTSFIPPDTTFWICSDVLDSTCTDSIEVSRTAEWDFWRIGCTSRDTTYWVCNSWRDSICGGRVRVSVLDPDRDPTLTTVKCSTVVSGADTTYIERPPQYYKCTLWVDSRCIDSVQTTGQDDYDWMSVDSLLRVDLSLGTDTDVPPLPQPWGVSVIYRFAEYPDSIAVDRLTLADNATHTLHFPNPNQYAQIIVGLSPATFSISPSFYRSFPIYIPMDVGYLATAKIVPPAQVPPIDAVSFYPYPNPVNTSLPNHERVSFRFTVPFDNYGEPTTVAPEIVVDLFTVAGERVRTLSGGELVGEVEGGVWEIGWDLRNDAGRAVASGAYIAIMRLYDSTQRSRLLVERKTKVAVIR